MFTHTSSDDASSQHVEQYSSVVFKNGVCTCTAVNLPRRGDVDTRSNNFPQHDSSTHTTDEDLCLERIKWHSGVRDSDLAHIFATDALSGSCNKHTSNSASDLERRSRKLCIHTSASSPIQSR